MYTMKEVCEKVHLPYETLRFYCNEGLVPNVKRAKNNYRCFDDRDIAWLNSLMCLKRCGMSLKDMKAYMQLCMQGRASIPARKVQLARQRALLLARVTEIEDCIAFIDEKQAFYDGVLAGRMKYTSNLIAVEHGGESQSAGAIIKDAEGGHAGR